jgi:hypothetical protein
MDLPDSIVNAPKGAQQLAFCFMMLVGLAQCFAGYRILRVLLVILGFCAGAILGFALGVAIGGGALFAGAIGALVCGIIGGLLMIPLFLVGIFLLGGLMGYLAAGVIVGVAGWHIDPTFLLLPAIAGGILAVLFQKVIIVIATALSGAWTVVICIYALVRGPAVLSEFDHPSSLGNGPLIGWLILSVLGIIAQFSWGEPDKAEKEAAPAEE